MTSPQEKLAESLEALHALQERGVVAVRSSDLSRAQRERLLHAGFLQEVMKGWYIPARPDEAHGESTAWYASFWDFCAAYLGVRFGEDWSLSPEQSLFIHTGNRSVPRQLLVRSSRARNKVTALAHDTSLLESRASGPPPGQVQIVDGLRLFSLPAALVASGPRIFAQNAADVRTALAMVSDASAVLAILLEGGHTTVAGRLAGAFRNIGRNRLANDILQTMRSAGYEARESDPFDAQAPFAYSPRALPPYVIRMHLSWQAMRGIAIDAFPQAPGLAHDKSEYLKSVDDAYLDDAYHSLSIEGYRVSRDLIERVRGGDWNPESDAGDRQQRDAMAARGYYEAFQIVKQSVRRVLDGTEPGAVVEQDHGAWYRALFAPSVTAGIIGAADLAGYRNGQVCIRRSRHVPPRHEAVRDLMPALFAQLTDETSAAVRAVLGHFMFEYIHPYMDGNGRMGRFLMNVILAAGGYPWTIIPVERRNEYMAALEAASIDRDIGPFARFLGDLVQHAGLRQYRESAPLPPAAAGYSQSRRPTSNG